MSLNEPVEIPDLDEFLEGDEPDWDTQPVPPRDQHVAEAMLRRLARIRGERSRDADLADARHSQIDAWFAARDESRQKQEGWLLDALERYHRAVLSIDPKSLSITLPSGRLTSREGSLVWSTEAEEFVGWLFPPPLRDRLQAVRNMYLAVAREALKVYECPLPEGVRLKPPPVEEIAVREVQAVLTDRDEKGKPTTRGVLPDGTTPPGLTVTREPRTFEVKLNDPHDEEVDPWALTAVPPRLAHEIAVPRTPVIGVDVHSQHCVDDDGHVECVCGLDREQEF